MKTDTAETNSTGGTNTMGNIQYVKGEVTSKDIHEAIATLKKLSRVLEDYSQSPKVRLQIRNSKSYLLLVACELYFDLQEDEEKNSNS